MPGPPVFYCLLELGQIHIGSFSDTVQPSHPPTCAREAHGYTKSWQREQSTQRACNSATFQQVETSTRSAKRCHPP